MHEIIVYKREGLGTRLLIDMIYHVSSIDTVFVTIYLLNSDILKKSESDKNNSVKR